MVKPEDIATEQHKVGIAKRYIYLYDIVLKKGRQGMTFQPYKANQTSKNASIMRHWVVES